MDHNYKKLIIIFIIAASLRMALFLAVGSWDDQILTERIIVHDATGYHKIALNFNEFNVFSRSDTNPLMPNIRRTPLYPVFLSLIYTLFGNKPQNAILFQIAINSLTCVLIYKIGQIIFNKQTALLASLFFAFEYSNILYSNQLLTETLFTFLFAIHIYLLLKFISKTRIKDLFYSSIFLGLSTLCRPVSIYFPLFLLLPFIVYFRSNIKFAMQRYGLLVLIFFLTIIPWMVRNYIVAGQFLLSSQQEEVLHWNLPNLMPSIRDASYTLVQGPNQFKGNKNRRDTGTSTKIKALNISEKKNMITSIMIDTMRYVKGIVSYFTALGSQGYPKLLGYPTYQMHRNDTGKGYRVMVLTALKKKNSFEWFMIFFSAGTLFFLYATMCVGIFTTVKWGRIKEIVLLVSVIAYFAIATGPSMSISERYRVPVMPYIIVLSSYGTTWLHDKFRNYKTKKT